MITKHYLISEELLKEVISGLQTYGKSAAELTTLEKLRNLEKHDVEEDVGGIPDVDSV